MTENMPRGAVVCATALALAAAAGGCGLFGPTPEERVRQAAALQDSIERRETFLELSAEPHPDMRPELRRILRENRDATIRALAAEALGRLGSSQDVSALRRALKNDRHWFVRKRALTWMCRILGSEATDDLRYALKNDPNYLVRAEAAKLALMHASEQEMFGLLVRALDDSSGAVRMLACVELANLTRGSFPPARQPWASYLRNSGLLGKPQR